MNREFEHWFADDTGTALRQAESKIVHKFMRQVAGPVVVQLGEFGGHDLLSEYGFPVSVIVSGSHPGIAAGVAGINAATEYLPFQGGQVSSIICPHVLEYAADPHQVLRELKRVLRPEGHMLLTGFNPWSLLGAGRPFRRSPPWHGSLIPQYRLVDWLRLLEFEITGSAMFFYSPTFKSATRGRISKGINAAGDRWWPMLGGAYIIVARKREVGMTMVGRKAKATLRPKPISRGSLVRQTTAKRNTRQ